MFGNAKPLASLSSGLLARKGTARPAMRPQGFGGMSSTNLEDLGWNDMGQEPAPAPVPPVLVQREALKEEIEAPVEAAPEPVAEVTPETVATPEEAAPAELRPVSLATATRIGRESKQQFKKGGKCAFTLRLDADRHLRLRLASALSGRSSQQLVTEALGAFLLTMPQVEALAIQLPKKEVR